LPSAVDLSAYRIAQEALTNVLKHAGPVHTVLVVRFCGDHVDVEVTNDAAPGPPSVYEGSGHGLVGMRERVGLLGGRLSAHARAEGGFAVLASLPLGGPQP